MCSSNDNFGWGKEVHNEPKFCISHVDLGRRKKSINEVDSIRREERGKQENGPEIG